MRHTKQKHSIKIRTALKQNCPFLLVLAGSTLLLFASCTFYNFDSNAEFEATKGVLNYGMPYIDGQRNVLNEPPLGFYVGAAFIGSFNLAPIENTGVIVTSLFGLGCIFLVYEIGKTSYGRKTGLAAASLFALAPWQVTMSRSFLIDTQCLFFSLLYLLVGIWAIRKNSFKLVMVSGIIFGIAFMTKFFAVFTLIPLTLFYVYHYKRNLIRILAGTAFFLPSAALFYLWYETILGHGLSAIFGHQDFETFNQPPMMPSPFFVGNYLFITLGASFLAATILSLTITFSQRRTLAKFISFDIVYLATFLAVASLDTYMGVGLNLKVPFVSAFKYDYQILPFLCLLAASIVGKSAIASKHAQTSGARKKLFTALRATGLVLLATSLGSNIISLFKISGQYFVPFTVEGVVNYAFNSSTQITWPNPRIAVMFVGTALILLGFVYSIKDELRNWWTTIQPYFSDGSTFPDYCSKTAQNIQTDGSPPILT